MKSAKASRRHRTIGVLHDGVADSLIVEDMGGAAAVWLECKKCAWSWTSCARGARAAWHSHCDMNLWNALCVVLGTISVGG